MEAVPPHNHKVDRIEEADLIPDPRRFDVVPDWQAPEGTEVTYLNAGTFRRYKMVDGAWRQIGSDPTAEFDIFSQFIDVINWPALDGFTTATIGAGGSAAPESATLALSTASGAAGGVFVHQKGSYYLGAAEIMSVEWIVRLTDAHGGQFDGYLQMVEGSGAYPVTTANHFGFWIDETNIVASNANGAAQTTTDTGEDITVSEGEQHRRLRAVYARGADIKFYVNDVLKATHATNLQSAATTFRITVGASTGNTSSEDLLLGRVLIQKQY